VLILLLSAGMIVGCTDSPEVVATDRGVSMLVSCKGVGTAFEAQAVNNRIRNVMRLDTFIKSARDTPAFRHGEG